MIHTKPNTYEATKAKFIERFSNEFNLPIPEYTPEVHDFLDYHGGAASYESMLDESNSLGVQNFAKSMQSFLQELRRQESLAPLSHKKFLAWDEDPRELGNLLQSCGNKVNTNKVIGRIVFNDETNQQMYLFPIFLAAIRNDSAEERALKIKELMELCAKHDAVIGEIQSFLNKLTR